MGLRWGGSSAVELPRAVMSCFLDFCGVVVGVDGTVVSLVVGVGGVVRWLGGVYRILVVRGFFTSNEPLCCRLKGLGCLRNGSGYYVPFCGFAPW